MEQEQGKKKKIAFTSVPESRAFKDFIVGEIKTNHLILLGR